MRLILFLTTIILLTNCSKPKTSFICGDHVCINKSEAEQYFADNLSIEVKVINNKNQEDVNLVELNLKENNNKRQEIIVFAKKETNNKLKVLSNNEVSKIKEDLKKRKKEKKITKKVVKKDQIEIRTKNIKKVNKSITHNNKERVLKNSIDLKLNDKVDVCKILEKCNIEEISRYLLKEGKKKRFPDITIRQ